MKFSEHVDSAVKSENLQNFENFVQILQYGEIHYFVQQKGVKNELLDTQRLKLLRIVKQIDDLTPQNDENLQDYFKYYSVKNSVQCL